MMTNEDLTKRLEKLTTDSKALFGIMSPQHMIEHIILTVKISYERIKIPVFTPNAQQLRMKEILLTTAAKFPQGIKAPGLDGQTLPLKFQNLETAISELKKAVLNYHEYFQLNPNQMTMHPRFGNLNKQEWDQFHAKHFEHHFSQFGI